MSNTHFPPVTEEEARNSLSRFIASHFHKSDRHYARFTIPVDEQRDDDRILSRFITEAARYRIALEEIAGHGCGNGATPQKGEPFRSCRDTHPDDRDEWCWSCIAADVLEKEL